jgi:Lanthionine synthetase C-like protein
VTALKLLAPGGEQVALARLAALMTPAGWNTPLEMGTGSAAPVNDLVLGTAGVVLAAVWAGGEHTRDIATIGGEALLRAADHTPGGLDWAMLPGRPSRMPNYSHGTAGIATALAIAGAALDRDDFIAAAQHGARRLLAVGSLEDGGFVLPHTRPYSRRDVEPVTYTWCHGPAGTSYLFAALADAGVGSVAGLEVTRLRHRCLHSILASGVPQRLRPGFWDNDGRCCGTAGVGDVLLDAAQDCTDQAAAGALLQAARTMGDALAERAIRDEAGARWRFLEHRQNPPLLPPGTSWMQGAAGIAAFLLRLARAVEGGLDTPVADRPDQWWGVPARLRTVHLARSAQAGEPGR